MAAAHLPHRALDSELRLRAAALAARLASGPLPPASPAGPDQTGNHTGQFPAAEQVAQVLTPGGAVVYSSGIEGTGPLLSPAQLRRVAKGPLTLIATIEGERLRLLASDVRRRSRPAITVVGVPTDIADAAQARARLALLIGGPPVVLAAGLGGWLLTGAALRPVSRMRRRLEEITEHDTSTRLPVPATGDEIAALAVTMNGLLDRLAQALARQRAFTADAGHELRTPLTALKAELELAARPGKSREALADAVQAAAGDTDRLIRLAEDLLLLARADEGTAFLAPEQIDMSSELHAAARRFASTAAARGVAVSVQAAGQLECRRRSGPGAAGARQPHRQRPPARPTGKHGGGHRPLRGGHRRWRRARRVVAVEVRDHGPGFPREFLPRAFERFQRADPARGRADGGAGLGLAIVATIAHAHHGKVAAGNHPSGGARVRIELPADSWP